MRKYVRVRERVKAAVAAARRAFGHSCWRNSENRSMTNHRSVYREMAPISPMLVPQPAAFLRGSAAASAMASRELASGH